MPNPTCLRVVVVCPIDLLSNDYALVNVLLSALGLLNQVLSMLFAISSARFGVGPRIFRNTAELELEISFRWPSWKLIESPVPSSSFSNDALLVHSNIWFLLDVSAFSTSIYNVFEIGLG